MVKETDMALTGRHIWEFGRKWSHFVNGMGNAGLFLGKFIRYPATVGSVCPSSGALADELVVSVPLGGNGVVIDLGAGSGPVSAALLRGGVAPERILAVDALPGFRAGFTRRCPGVTFIAADARDLKAILDRHAPGRKISAVISSLPLRVLPAKTTQAALSAVKTVLAERGGFFVQYSYAWWLRYPLRSYGFSPRSASMVYRNLPPARVEAYRGDTLTRIGPDATMLTTRDRAIADIPPWRR